MSNPDMEESEAASNSVYKRSVREIEDLHQFFEDWLSGELPNTGEAFRRLDRALVPEFRLVHPSGEWRRREDILTGLRQAHGSRPGLTIEIRDVRLREAGEDLVAATYDEWQRSKEEEDGRRSTVVFRRTPEASTGLRWLHVHETWLSESE